MTHQPLGHDTHFEKKGKVEDDTRSLYVGKSPGTQLSVLFYIFLPSVGQE